MKHMLSLLLLLFCHCAFGQTSGGWNKTYSGTILEVNSFLKGNATNGNWSATIDAQGYVYELAGKINGNQSTGTLSDNNTGGTLPFSAVLGNDQITITLTFTDPNTGNSENFDILFTEVKENAASPKPTTTTATNIDRSLIGQWRRTETYVSGDFSFATDYFVQFNPDGTATYTDGKSAGGGASSSIVTEGGESYEIVWKTEKNILYAKDVNDAWIPYAKYYVEGNSLMVTFDDGSRQIWERL